ncbi:Ff.00g009970.m01.CDS01 [Fusarium sp. VM40]|nr:Ff.00g009970.m01.CDS01 [Fusarium sp. VM40]
MMAEPAQPELSAVMSPTGIKQEPNHEVDILEGLGLDLDSIMQAATKRPFEDHSNGDDPNKRVKAETEPVHETTLELDQGAEESLEDGLALLVQNALSNANDFAFSTDDPMEIDGITDHPLPPPPPPPSPPSITFFSDPQTYLRKASRHALGNMALSVLLLFSQSFDDSIKPIQDADSQHAKSFHQLQSSFAQIKQIYSSGPILSADEPDLQDHESRTILDLANLAQFGIWLLQATPSYPEAHEHFHAIFRGQVSDLGSDALDLYLSLKTQVAIDALATKTPEQSNEQVLEEALINGMEDKLRGLHNGFDLTPADSEFVTSVRLRKASLEGETSTEAAQSYLNQLQQQQAQNTYYSSYTQSVPEPQPPPPEPGQHLPPNQTCPSAMLYDKARQAALSKNSSHTRREGLHSTRRPWTQDEEKALMAGLDLVKGPHWSQILTLFGPAGTMSDILKDRTQVQLKDKARNLKLFFLKTNSEMPYYLQAVTGELKTRAPTQAARKEAEERARMNSEEDQAKLQGIMTLAGGLQNPPNGQGRAAGTPASAVGSGVMTPAQAASLQQGQAHNQANAHSYNPATSSGYPPSTLPQARPSVMSGAQQSPHQAARPQSQMSMSPQTPRSQHQQIPQQNHSAMHSPAHAHAAAQNRSHTSTPVGQLHHSPPAQHTPTPQPAAQHHNRPQYSGAPHTQLTFPSPPPTNATPSMHAHTHAHVPVPETHMDQHMHDNAAEAALLQGLQAAVADSL